MKTDINIFEMILLSMTTAIGASETSDIIAT